MPIAVFATIFGFSLSLFLAVNLSFFFFALIFLYILLHIFYTLYLKKIAILDVLAIASGFVIRVYAGAVAADAHINVWLLLCVISFSLFLAIGKRRSERTLLEARAENHREVLTRYPEKLLNIYTSMFANTTWLTYAFFTFLQPSGISEEKWVVMTADLPRTFMSKKWLMLTIPVVIYGVMRYLQLIYEKGEGDSPEKVLLSDKPLLTSVCLWGMMVVGIIYGIG